MATTGAGRVRVCGQWRRVGAMRGKPAAGAGTGRAAGVGAVPAASTGAGPAAGAGAVPAAGYVCVRVWVCMCVHVCAAGAVCDGGLLSAHDLALDKAKVCRVQDHRHSANPFCFVSFSNHKLLRVCGAIKRFA